MFVNYKYCNPLTAMTMVEDKKGKVWVYALNMDMMIHGGKPLPDNLLKKANKMKDVILKIMEAGATGEF